MFIGTLHYLSQKVKWEPGEENVREELCHTEHPINHPVSQPLGVVVFGGALDGFDSDKK